MILLIGIGMSLHMHKDMQNLAHDKLIKQDDPKERHKDNYGGIGFHAFRLTTIGLLVLHLNRMHKEMRLSQQYKVEHSSDDGQEQDGKQPPLADQVLPGSIRLVDVLPDDLVRLRGLLYGYLSCP